MKRWLQSQGIYPFGFPKQKMDVPPCGYYEKRWGGGKYTKNGLPDLHIVVNRISIEVELKADNGRPSALQYRNIDFIRECGCYAFIVYPEHFEMLKTTILRLKEGILI